MSQLQQGRIIRATVIDPQGRNSKPRPLVIVSSTSEIGGGEPFVAVAITSYFADPLEADEVELPWHPAGRVRTGLKKPSVAKCSWLCEVNVSDVLGIYGIAPRVQMEQIINIVKSLNDADPPTL